MSINAAEPGRPLGTVTGIAAGAARRDGGTLPDVVGKVMSITALAPSAAPGGGQR